jgi:hypothetical protein
MLKEQWTETGSVLNADGLMNAMSMKKVIRGGQNNEINKDFDTGNCWWPGSFPYQGSPFSGDRVPAGCASAHSKGTLV